MNDPEFIDLRNKVLLGIGICLVLFVPFFFFIRNHLIVDESTIIKRINNNDTFIIFVTDKKCKDCKKYKKTLKNNKVDYNIINIDKDKNYKKILKELDIESTEITPPSLIYVNEGQPFATLVKIGDEEGLQTFINNFNIGE